MFEYFIDCIVKELGPTGLLIVGLYWVIGKSLNKIAQSLDVINSETGEVRDVLKEIKTIIEIKYKHEN